MSKKFLWQAFVGFEKDKTFSDREIAQIAICRGLAGGLIVFPLLLSMAPLLWSFCCAAMIAAIIFAASQAISMG